MVPIWIANYRKSCGEVVKKCWRSDFFKKKNHSFSGVSLFFFFLAKWDLKLQPYVTISPQARVKRALLVQKSFPFRTSTKPQQPIMDDEFDDILLDDYNIDTLDKSQPNVSSLDGANDESQETTTPKRPQKKRFNAELQVFKDTGYGVVE